MDYRVERKKRCPMRFGFKETRMNEGQPHTMDTSFCVEEECAWWLAVHKQCAIRKVALPK